MKTEDFGLGFTWGMATAFLICAVLNCQLVDICM